MFKTVQKRITALFLVLVLLLSVAGTAALAEDDIIEDNLLTFEIVDGEAVAIACDPAASGELVLPDAIGGYPVTGIGEQAFDSCSRLIAIKLGKNVAAIGEQAFYGCTSLKKFTVDEANAAFTTDETGALYDKEKTLLMQYPIGLSSTAFTVPDGVTAVGAYAFAHARKLQSIALPESLTEIRDYAFYYCVGITDSMIPNAVKSIGFSAFEFCTGLASVSLGSGVQTIGERAFFGCKALTQITVETDNACFIAEDNVLYTKEKTALVQYPVGDPRTAFTVPDGVTNIGMYAFGYAENLQRVTLPDELTELGESAFYHCSDLKTVNIPGSVTIIGGDAFRACKNLESIVLPDGLTSIGYYACYGCEKLEQIIIPESVTHVGYQAFYGCKSLAFAHLPRTIEYMDGDLFGNCPNLAFVCADTADCYAKTYAAENSFPFHVCGGSHPVIAPHHPDSDTSVNLEYEPGAFSGKAFLLAEPVGYDELFMEYPACETALSLNPRETIRGAYRIHIVDEAGNPVTLNDGQTARLFLAVPEDGETKKSRVCRIADETGSQIDSYKLNPKAGSADKTCAVTEDEGYFILDLDRFGAFILVEETVDPTIAIRGFVPYRSEGYKTTISFSAVATLPPDGATIHWFVNETDSGTGEAFTVRRAKADYTIQARLIDEDGETVLAESETEWVYIKTGFWAKVLAFLRMLVFRLPKLTQK